VHTASVEPHGINENQKVDWLAVHSTAWSTIGADCHALGSDEKKQSPLPIAGNENPASSSATVRLNPRLFATRCGTKRGTELQNNPENCLKTIYYIK
jgi:hypothetical protein